MDKRSRDLKRAGLKVTIPRSKILSVLECEQKHLSAEDIYKVLLDEGDPISIATIYRVLTNLESANLVLRHNFENGHSVYELNRGDQHDHMVCLKTGKIVEFSNDHIEALKQEVAKSYGYDIIDHTLVLYGTPSGEEND